MKKKLVVIVFALIFAGCLVQVAWAVEKEGLPDNNDKERLPRLADVNPGFTKFLEEKAAGKWTMVTETGQPLGLIPAPVDLGHLKGKKIPLQAFAEAAGVEVVTETALPDKYDLRPDHVTRVKDQGQCGSCWAFATYGSLESYFTLLPFPEIWDFSENNLKNTHGFDIPPCSGGNADMSTAYLARWSGPVDESRDPYKLPIPSSYSPSGLPAVKYVQEVLYIPERDSSIDNGAIKSAIMTTGAVYTILYWDSSDFNDVTDAYYYSGEAGANHAVALVGWDDTYSKTNFGTQPQDDGAFIARNSWGTGFGDGGYFFISYDDSLIGDGNAVFTGEGTTAYKKSYQYDTLGATTYAGYGGSETASFANVFTATSAGKLSAVGFYTPVPDSLYEIKVYLNPRYGPVSSSGPVLTQTGIISIPGYHTVKLNTPVSLTNKKKFSVVVKLTTPGYNYPAALEMPFSGYSSKAKASSGQSYISPDGVTWTDITRFFQNTNTCLKAFAT